MIRKKCYGKELLEKELKGSFDFFIKENNLNKQSKGYGLVRDLSQTSQDVASTASVRL